MNLNRFWLHLLRQIAVPYLLIVLIIGTLGLLANLKYKQFHYKDIETKEHYNLMVKKRELEKLLPKMVTDLYYTSKKFSGLDIRSQVYRKKLSSKISSTYQWPLSDTYQKVLITNSKLLPIFSIDAKGEHFHKSKEELNNKWIKKLEREEIGTNLSRPTDYFKEFFVVKSFRDIKKRKFYLFLYFPPKVIYEHGNRVLSSLRPRVALTRETDHEVVLDMSQTNTIQKFIKDLRSEIKTNGSVRSFFQGINLTDGGSFEHDGNIVILEKTNLIPSQFIDENNLATITINKKTLYVDTEPYYLYATLLEKDVKLHLKKTISRIWTISFFMMFISFIFIFVFHYQKYKKEEEEPARTVTKDNLFQKAQVTEQKEIFSSFVHEISNPLSVIMTLSNQIQKNVGSKTPSKEKVLKHGSKISEMVLKIKTIMDQVRKSKKTKINDPVQESDLNLMLQSALDLCSPHLEKADCKLEIDVPLELPSIECRMTQIIQVFTNMIINSCEAIHNLKDRWVNIKIEEQDNFIRFEITDSGTGIAPDIKKQMMNAFYSTKPGENSAGLGLAIAKRIVLEHDGQINICPQGNNTCFEIRLPKRSHKVKAA